MLGSESLLWFATLVVAPRFAATLDPDKFPEANYDLSVTLEVDFIFPEDGGVYKPVYPFPVVFRLRNWAVIWPYDVDFGWELSEDAYGSGGLYRPNAGEPDAEMPSPPPANRFLFINSTDFRRLVTNHGASQSIEQAWNTIINWNCTGEKGSNAYKNAEWSTRSALKAQPCVATVVPFSPP
ncbi:hypothetical protein B0T10DRAFT_461498 [Thelonectria olida]|uniref:DUF7136 domain-containing protein n=1 Tax=Thelonectria olida TaxID=1576542 RepID=A0A9P8W3Y1_9HYPO|nr:hypothetical protein B0T10DRAFT_461498 [Thelonectria olida]